MLETKLLNNTEFINSLVETCIKQISKFSSQNLNYKNWVIKLLSFCLEKSEMIKNSNSDQILSLLLFELTESLIKVSSTASLIDSQD